MLSVQSVPRMLGKDILIYPFDERKLKGVGYNLSVSKYAWSLSAKKPLVRDKDNKGRDVHLIEPGDTALIWASETLWVSKRIGGTFHSKVDRVSEGFSSISTTLDPEWIGPLLIAIINLTATQRQLRVGDSLATVVFHRIEKAGIPRTANPSGRLDRLTGLEVPPDAAEWLNDEIRQSPVALREKLLSDEDYREMKRRLGWTRAARFLLPWVPLGVAIAVLAYLAATGAKEGAILAVVVAMISALGIGVQAQRER